ncbi:hypothetical protein V2J09_006189 [Rumex salicifolius]
MKKVITIDGGFLKTKYKGVLLTAVAQNANMQIFPLVFVVVDSENDEYGISSSRTQDHLFLIVMSKHLYLILTLQ